jgi:phosphate transport system protein
MMAGGAGRPHFQKAMGDLEHGALGGLDMVSGQLIRVLDAVARTDLALADVVIADDARVDGRYLEVHQGVLSLLALQAPVAGDLRLVAAVLHLIDAIERIGDQCVNIAKLVVLAPEAGDDAAIAARIQDMGAAAVDALRLAREAFAGRDVALARSLGERDRTVDRLDREIFRRAVALGEDPAVREWAMTTTLVARAIERIGGNACDIAEQAIFVATGEFPEPPVPAGRRRS